MPAFGKSGHSLTDVTSCLRQNSGGEAGIDSNRLRAILTPAGRLRRPKRYRVLSNRVLIPCPLTKLVYALGAYINFGGEGGIRTRGTGLPYTCFPSKRLKPLGHLSV